MDYLLFAIVCVTVSVSPGPAVLYIVTRTLDQGIPAGLASIAGISTGGIVHVCLAAFGVAAAAAAWPLSLVLLQALGAIYLVWLGWQRIRSARQATVVEATENASLSDVFRQGAIVNLTNPKTALFLLAFLPQFVDPGAAPLSRQLLLLGMTFVALASLTDGAYVLAAGTLRRRLSGSSIPPWSGYLAGAIYGLLGAAGFIDAVLDLPRPAVGAPGM